MMIPEMNQEESKVLAKELAHLIDDDSKREEIIKHLWGDERPIYAFCPICEGVLERSGPFSGFGKATCSKCEYEYQQCGSYASRVTIKGSRFGLDDMFDDSEKMNKRIEEEKNNKGP